MNTCEHVYKLMGVDPCPLCGKPTHEINWRKEQERIRDYYASGKDKDFICSQGGTIRGWWSI